MSESAPLMFEGRPVPSKAKRVRIKNVEKYMTMLDRRQAIVDAALADPAPSLRELAKRFNTSASSIHDRLVKAGVSKKRAKHRITEQRREELALAMHRRWENAEFRSKMQGALAEYIVSQTILWEGAMDEALRVLRATVPARQFVARAEKVLGVSKTSIRDRCKELGI